MAYTAPQVVSTGELATADIQNTQIVASIVALYAGEMSVASQAVGDLLYASSTTQWARIADVAVGQVLVSGGVGVAPAWSNSPTISGTLTVTGAISSAASVALTGTTNNLGTITTGIWNAGAVTSSGATGGFIINPRDGTGDIFTIYNPTGNDWRVFNGAADKLIMTTAGALQLPNYGAGTATFDASGNITSVSDVRFKDRIEPLLYGLKEVLQLHPIQYGYNAFSALERDHLYGGFDAAQVQPFMPLAVGQDSRGYLTLADRPILGAVVNALHEVEIRLRQLERSVL